MQRFTGRSVVLTGAGSGIGAATAKRLAAEGAVLTISDVNAEGLEQTASACREAGATVTALVSDVSDESAVAELIATAVGLFVAIPAVVSYNIFTQKIRAALSECESLRDLYLSRLSNAASGGT
jgi:NAD(P)-dependent dehydrogenase (short-subunit alcohol dehydrogenase family)